MSSEAAMRGGSRLGAGDALRAVGALAVVVLHAAGGGMGLFDAPAPAARASWWAYNVVNAACRWVVPAFVMLSGALLLDPAKGRETLGAFYRKRLARIGVPLAFWSAFYLAARPWLTGRSAVSEDAAGSAAGAFAGALKPLLFANPFYHLYFLFVLAGLYLFTPALRAVCAAFGAREVRFFGGAALALACVDTFVRSWFGLPLNAFSISAPYVGYYLLGYGLRGVRLSSVERALCAAGFAASVAATAAGTAWAMGRWDAAGPDAAMRGYFTYFLSPTVVAMSLCVFLLFVGGGNGAAPAPPRPFTAFLARVSFGVYLVHPFFLSLVQRAGFRADTAPVWLYLPGTVAAVFALSVATTAALQALRLTRPLVG